MKHAVFVAKHGTSELHVYKQPDGTFEPVWLQNGEPEILFGDMWVFWEQVGVYIDELQARSLERAQDRRELIDRLFAAISLAAYAQHEPGCCSLEFGGVCSCGLEHARAQWRKAVGEPQL